MGWKQYRVGKMTLRDLLESWEVKLLFGIKIYLTDVGPFQL
jgi:hypothetical protein